MDLEESISSDEESTLEIKKLQDELEKMNDVNKRQEEEILSKNKMIEKINNDCDLLSKQVEQCKKLHSSSKERAKRETFAKPSRTISKPSLQPAIDSKKSENMFNDLRNVTGKNDFELSLSQSLTKGGDHKNKHRSIKTGNQNCQTQKLPQSSIFKKQLKKSCTAPCNRNKVLLLTDSHGHTLQQKLSTFLSDSFEVSCLLKPGAKLNSVMMDGNLTSLHNKLTKKDFVIIIGGTNNINPNSTSHHQEIIEALHISEPLGKVTNVVYLSIFDRYDVNINDEIAFVNSLLRKWITDQTNLGGSFHFLHVNDRLERGDFTRHGLHLNKRGKIKLVKEISCLLSTWKTNDKSQNSSISKPSETPTVDKALITTLQGWPVLPSSTVQKPACSTSANAPVTPTSIPAAVRPASDASAPADRDSITYAEVASLPDRRKSLESHPTTATSPNKHFLDKSEEIPIVT